MGLLEGVMGCVLNWIKFEFYRAVKINKSVNKTVLGFE
jgi:hypothetical protein